jgi:putative endonuclease
MGTWRQEQGGEWEAAARRYLEARGLRFVAANYRCKCGEIDLIMRDGDALVFVEVRQRAAGSPVSALESIGPAKVRRIVRAAQVYLQALPRVPPCRIDVVAIDGDSLQWLPNAIEV